MTCCIKNGAWFVHPAAIHGSEARNAQTPMLPDFLAIMNQLVCLVHDDHSARRPRNRMTSSFLLYDRDLYEVCPDSRVRVSVLLKWAESEEGNFNRRISLKCKDKLPRLLLVSVSVELTCSYPSAQRAYDRDRRI